MTVRQKSFIQPRSPVFWVFTMLVAFGVVRVGPLIVGDLFVFPAEGAFAAVLWGAYAVVLGLILYRAELFQRRSGVTIASALLWGVFVVTGIGVTAAPAMGAIFESILGPDNSDWVSAFAAPLTEEPLKMLGVVALAMIPGAHIRTTLDGLFYGLLVGLGFEVTESFLYTTNTVADRGGGMSVVVGMFILRGFFGGLWSHPTFTAISGAGVGYFVSSERSLTRRVLVAAGSLMTAIVLHGLIDSPVLGGLGLAGGIVKGIPALAVLVVILTLARRHERSRFDHVAADAIDHSLIGSGERETLLHHGSRRRARREMRRKSGREAALALERLQTAQIDLVEAAIDGGVGSATYEQQARVVRELKTAG